MNPEIVLNALSIRFPELVEKPFSPNHRSLSGESGSVRVLHPAPAPKPPVRHVERPVEKGPYLQHHVWLYARVEHTNLGSTDSHSKNDKDTV